MLQAGPEGATLTEVARGLGSQGPPVLHHLRNLVIEGRLARLGEQRGPRYVAQRSARIEWIEPRLRRTWSWESRAIDWRYPLASRLPDAPAQESAALVLRMADEDGLFHLAARRGVGRHPGRAPEASDASAVVSHGVRVFAYGSCARGDAGPRSDLDLLWLTGPSIDVAREIREITATASLVAPRNIDSKTVPVDKYKRLPGRLREELEREALIVFSSYAGGEAEPLPGGRPHG